MLLFSRGMNVLLDFYQEIPLRTQQNNSFSYQSQKKALIILMSRRMWIYSTYNKYKYINKNIRHALWFHVTFCFSNIQDHRCGPFHVFTQSSVTVCGGGLQKYCTDSLEGFINLIEQFFFLFFFCHSVNIRNLFLSA